MTTATQALDGARLEQLLDHLEADLQEADSSQAIDLLARLRAQALRADSLDAIERLHTLWMRAGDSEAALAVVDIDGGALLAATPAPQRRPLAMRLACIRLQIAHYLSNEEAARRALAQMREIAGGEDWPGAADYLHMPLLDRLEDGPPEVALDTIELRSTLERSLSDHARLRAYDLADYHRRRAYVLARAARPDDARAEAAAAIEALRAAAPDQEVDASDWLWLADGLIEIAPECLREFQQPVERLIADLTPPQRREMEVRLARLTARALHAQGGLQAALDACPAARYSLDASGGDDFIEFELPWLIEAGRTDEAGRRAFFHIYQLETMMQPEVATIVHERLAEPSDHSVWWALCVMRACNTEDTLGCFVTAVTDDCDELRARSATHARLFKESNGAITDALDAIFAAARALATERAPDHPWIRRLAAVHDQQNGVIDAATAAAQVLAASVEGGMDDGRTQVTLAVMRTQAMGFAEVLKLPPPTLPSGLHAYHYGCWFDDFSEYLDDDPDWFDNPSWQRYAQILQLVYEQGLRHCERYVETGTGHPYDACAHLYSMMCNNLAIIYSHKQHRYEEALAVHERGIRASPFAEHYHGVLNCYIGLRNWAEVVNAAERLWQFTAEHGYSRHDPNEYVDSVANALNNLDRDREILLWLERLVKWQRENGEDDAKLSAEALKARLDVGLYLGNAFPEESARLWTELMPQIEAARDYILWFNAAIAAERRNDNDPVIPYLRRALEMNPQDTPYKRNHAVKLQEMIAEREARRMAPPVAPAGKRPWWKIW